MDVGGRDVEDAGFAVGGAAAGLFGDEGEGVGFVEEAEFASGVGVCGWVKEDTAFEKSSVEIGNE